MWIPQLPEGRFFEEEQRRQVRVLFDAIIPGGPEAPSASEVGADEYLDRLLAMDGSVYYEIPTWKRLYADALPALDAASRSTFGGRALTELSRDEVGQLIRALSQGQLPGMAATINQRAFFSVLRSHCIEGCFADPRWGGNAAGAMWKWFGYLTRAEPFRREGAAGPPGVQPPPAAPVSAVDLGAVEPDPAAIPLRE
jgi:gluconate 2-dehydrogenase gamma chain